MSADKAKMDQLISKLDELLSVLGKATEELRTISASMKSLAVAQITQPVPQTPTSVPRAAAESGPRAVADSGKKRSLDDIRMSFPEDLEARLTFEEKGDYIIIKPKQFLGSENFAKIASAARGMGGEYISAGKDSHFRVPKKKA